jgi:hypothetical protein
VQISGGVEILPPYTFINTTWYNLLEMKGNTMSFDTLKISELKKIAEGFGVDVPEKPTKQSIITALTDEGITYDSYAQFSGADKVELEKPKAEKKINLNKSNTILVRMDKANPSYTVYGYTFTQEHPFVAMSEEDAQRIFDTEPGFRPATPREAQEFYN